MQSRLLGRTADDTRHTHCSFASYAATLLPIMTLSVNEHHDEKLPGHLGPDGVLDDSHDTSSHEDHDDNDSLTHGTNEDLESAGAARPKTARASEADARGTAANVLSHISSRLSTRGWPEPPPPPDGGVHAWTQVACVRLSFLNLYL